MNLSLRGRRHPTTAPDLLEPPARHRSETGSSGSSTEVERTPQPSWSAAFPEPPARTMEAEDGLTPALEGLGISNHFIENRNGATPVRRNISYRRSHSIDPFETDRTQDPSETMGRRSVSSEQPSARESFLPTVNPETKIRDLRKRHHLRSDRASDQQSNHGIMSFLSQGTVDDSVDLEEAVAASMAQSFVDQRSRSLPHCHDSIHLPVATQKMVAARNISSGFTILLDSGRLSANGIFRRGSAPMPSFGSAATGDDFLELDDNDSDDDSLALKDPHLMFDSPPDRSSMYFDAPVSPSAEDLDLHSHRDGWANAAVDWSHFIESGYSFRPAFDGFSKGPQDGEKCQMTRVDSTISDMSSETVMFKESPSQQANNDAFLTTEDTLGVEETLAPPPMEMTRTGVDWLDDEIEAEVRAASSHLPTRADRISQQGGRDFGDELALPTQPLNDVKRSHAREPKSGASSVPLNDFPLSEFDIARTAAQNAFADAILAQEQKLWRREQGKRPDRRRDLGINTNIANQHAITRRSPRSHGLPLSPPPSAHLPALPETISHPQQVSLTTQEVTQDPSQSNSLGLFGHTRRPGPRRALSDQVLSLVPTSALPPPRTRPATTENATTALRERNIDHDRPQEEFRTQNIDGRNTQKAKKRRNKEAKASALPTVPLVTPRNASLGATRGSRHANPSSVETAQTQMSGQHNIVDDSANARRLQLMGECVRDNGGAGLLRPEASLSSKRPHWPGLAPRDGPESVASNSVGGDIRPGNPTRKNGLREKISGFLAHGPGSAAAVASNEVSNSRNSLSLHSVPVSGRFDRRVLTSSEIVGTSKAPQGENKDARFTKHGVAPSMLRTGSDHSADLSMCADKMSIASIGSGCGDERSIPVYPPGASGSSEQMSFILDTTKSDRTRSVISTKTSSSFGVPSNMSSMSSSTTNRSGLDEDTSSQPTAVEDANASPRRKSLDSLASFPVTVSAKSIASASGRDSRLAASSNHSRTNSQGSGMKHSAHSGANASQSVSDRSDNGIREQRVRTTVRNMTESGKIREEVIMEGLSLDKNPSSRRVQKGREGASPALSTGSARSSASKRSRSLSDEDIHRHYLNVEEKSSPLRVDDAKEKEKFVKVSPRLEEATIQRHFNLSRPSLSGLTRPSLSSLMGGLKVPPQSDRPAAPSAWHEKSSTTIGRERGKFFRSSENLRGRQKQPESTMRHIRQPPTSWGRSGNLAPRLTIPDDADMPALTHHETYEKQNIEWEHSNKHQDDELNDFDTACRDEGAYASAAWDHRAAYRLDDFRRHVSIDYGSSRPRHVQEGAAYEGGSTLAGRWLRKRASRIIG